MARRTNWLRDPFEFFFFHSSRCFFPFFWNFPTTLTRNIPRVFFVFVKGSIKRGLGIVMKNNLTKFRLSNLKNQRAKVILVKSKKYLYVGKFPF